MNVFAGFWVDGAVRKPEQRHKDKEGCVICRWKYDANADFDVMLKGYENWHKVYWLDTTPRESLTPEELLALARVLWPDIATIYKHEDVWYSDCQGKDSSSHVKVDWGNLTQYPPPVEPQWVRITRENVGQYMFRECRFWDTNESWHNGHVVGWDIIDDCCLVSSDRSEIEPVLQWSIVEVQA